MVTVVTSESYCPQCKMTINYLKNHDIDFKVKVGRKDLTPAENAIRLLHDKAAPLVITPKNGSWVGFRPDKLKQLKI